MPVLKRQQIEPYLGRLFAYALQLTDDRESARDLVQDCAVKALAAKQVPKDEPAIRAWLFKILRHAHYDRLRRPTPLDTAEALSSDNAPSINLWDADDRMIYVLTVRLALRQLPAPQREILALVDVAGLSYAEASRVLDIPPGTVMSRLARARKALLDLILRDNIVPLRPQQKRRHS